MATSFTPTDAQLSIIANNNNFLVDALRTLFNQAGTLTPSDISTLTASIEAVSISADNAGAAATEASASLSRIIDTLEALALAPQNEVIPRDDFDLSPRYEP